MASSSPAAEPPRLRQSLFSRDASGSLSEGDLQKIVDSRIEVSFPFRVGVVSLAEPFKPESSAPVGEQGIIASRLTSALKGSPRFSHVTDVSTDLPNPAGIEGLRTIAARYRLRYLLLCDARMEDESHLNNWAWLYPTIVGLLAAPGMTVGSRGLLQASLLDVSAGTVLFTATEPFESAEVSWLIGANRTQREGDGQAMSDAAQRLAGKVLAQTDYLASWVSQENAARAGAARGDSAKE